MFSPWQSAATGRAGGRGIWRRRGGRIARELLSRSLAFTLLLLVLAAIWPQKLSAQTVSVTHVRHWSLGDVTRIAIQTSGEFTYKFNSLSNPPRYYFDIQNSRQRLAKDNMHAVDVNDGLVQHIRVSQNKRSVTRVVLDLGDDVVVTASQLANPDRLMVEVRRKSKPPEIGLRRKLPPPSSTAAEPGRKPAGVKTAKAVERREAPSEAKTDEPKQVAVATPPAEPQSAAAEPESEPEEEARVATPAKRNNGGGHSLTRVLGLKLGRVVIDPGHGGKDTGTIGRSGLKEKDIVLDVAQRLGQLIKEKMGSEVVLTRDKDVTVPLEKRTKIANDGQADLFISIHVNASRYRNVNGVETFYLNFTRSRADLEVAARENAGSSQTIHELSNLVQKIALDDKVRESRDLATNLQTSVHKMAAKRNSKARNRGVKKAPFVVLIGAQMPSVLVELGFISNTQEEKLMNSTAYRQELAEALFAGISEYADSLSHYQVARSSGPSDDE